MAQINPEISGIIRFCVNTAGENIQLVEINAELMDNSVTNVSNLIILLIAVQISVKREEKGRKGKKIEIIRMNFTSIDEEDEFQEEIEIDDSKFTFKLDIGAQANCISENTFQKVYRENVLDRNTKDVKLISFSNDIIIPIGKVKLKCKIEDKW